MPRQYTLRRKFMLGLGLLGWALLGGVGCVHAVEPVALPAYPRVRLGNLYNEASRDPMRLSGREPDLPTTPFVVIGRVVRAAAAGTQADLFVDDVMACCVAHSVAFRLEAGSGLKDGEWLALYGKLVEVNSEPAVAQAPWRRERSVLVAGGYELVVELTVPAERLMYPDNVVDMMSSESLGLFMRALRETGLDERLKVAEAVTILAPVDEGFNRFTPEALEALFSPDGRSRLGQLVLAHLVPERLIESDLRERRSLTTLGGSSLPVSHDNGVLRINGSRILFGDIRGRNGVVHLIAPAFSPEDLQAPPPPPPGQHSFDPLSITP